MRESPRCKVGSAPAPSWIMPKAQKSEAMYSAVFCYEESVPNCSKVMSMKA